MILNQNYQIIVTKLHSYAIDNISKISNVEARKFYEIVKTQFSYGDIINSGSGVTQTK